VDFLDIRIYEMGFGDKIGIIHLVFIAITAKQKTAISQAPQDFQPLLSLERNAVMPTKASGHEADVLGFGFHHSPLPK
jgi:hypothetical protein